MSDIAKNMATFLVLEVEGGFIERYTTHWTSATYGTGTYTPMQALEVEPIVESSDLSKECTINGLQIAGNILQGLATHLPYPAVNVEIFYGEVDINNIVQNKTTIYIGLVYQSLPRLASGYMSLICRDRKYFTDRSAGIPCIEQCHAAFFGDSKICQASVTRKEFTIQSATNNYITVTEPVTDPNKSFHKGYIEFAGVVIGIRYWVSGQVFQLRRPIPQSWVGLKVEFAYGCDKTIDMCRNVHNNESRFLGAGFGMMDYDPNYAIS
jgi:hypothetical protein